MSILYKLISNWNPTISNDNFGLATFKLRSDDFSDLNNGGNYDIIYDNTYHVTFSLSNSLDIFYSKRENGEYITENTGFQGLNPKIVINNDKPFIVYYDKNTFSYSYIIKNGNKWTRKKIDNVNLFSSFNNRILDIKKEKNDLIHICYIYSISDSERNVRYAVFNGSKWSKKNIFTDNINPNSCSIVLNQTPVVFIGANDGIFSYLKQSKSFKKIGSFFEDNVEEIDSVKNNKTVHISYLSNDEIRYQKFNLEINSFMEEYNFIDFNSKYISIDLDDKKNPIMSYFHIEDSLPPTFYLKISKFVDNEFISLNIDQSESFMSGALSDIAHNNNNFSIVYFNENEVRVYDQELFLSNSNIKNNLLRDDNNNNNLIASDNPPIVDFNSNSISFLSNDKNYYYLPNSELNIIGQPTTNFSIAITFIPNDHNDVQTIVSKNGLNNQGFEIFINRNKDDIFLGFKISTNQDSIQAKVKDISEGLIYKVGFVYSGFDLKIYIKSQNDNDFSLFKYNISGDISINENPFVIGANAIVLDNNDYSYSSNENNFDFFNFFNSKLITIKYWDRELDYEEATYDINLVENYDKDIDPYSFNLNGSLYQSSFGDLHFITKAEDFTSRDLGGVKDIQLFNYSKFLSENRLNNSIENTFDPHSITMNHGGNALLFSDFSDNEFYEIYIKFLNDNNNVDNKNSLIKSHGRNLSIHKNSNIVEDPFANFIEDSVYVGDFVNLVSGNYFSGKKIAIIDILGENALELATYFSNDDSNISYFISDDHISIKNEKNIQLTNIDQNSFNPFAIDDKIGDLHIVWQSLEEDLYQIYYKRFRKSLNKNQIWGDIKITNDDIGNNEFPSIAIDNESNLHLVWLSSRNRIKSVFYAISSPVLNNIKEPTFPYWSSSGFGGEDQNISFDLDCNPPIIKSDDLGNIHIVFSSNGNIYYINNIYGYLSYPAKITDLNNVSRYYDFNFDNSFNLYVIFSSGKSIKDLYILKFDNKENKWLRPFKIFSSDYDVEKIKSDITMDNKIFISFINNDNLTNIIYDISKNKIIKTDYNASDLEGTQVSCHINTDFTNTTKVFWSDNRSSNNTSDLFMNSYADLDLINKSNVIEDDSIFINVNENDQVISQEDISDVTIIYSDDKNELKFSPFDFINFNDRNAVLNFRKINVKIKGLTKTIGYRIRNIDNNESFSNFNKFSPFEDGFISFSWILSKENGEKKIGIQLLTTNGVTQEFTNTFFLNEKDIFEIEILNSDNNKINNFFNSKMALKNGTYIVNIKPFKFVDVEKENVVFDLKLQGKTLSNLETEVNNGMFTGSFSIKSQDGIVNVDGDAKITPKIVEK